MDFDRKKVAEKIDKRRRESPTLLSVVAEGKTRVSHRSSHALEPRTVFHASDRAEVTRGRFSAARETVLCASYARLLLRRTILPGAQQLGDHYASLIAPSARRSRPNRSKRTSVNLCDDPLSPRLRRAHVARNLCAKLRCLGKDSERYSFCNPEEFSEQVTSLERAEVGHFQ